MSVGGVGAHALEEENRMFSVLSRSCSHLCSPSKAGGLVRAEGEEGSEEQRSLSFHLNSANNLACSLDSGTQLPTCGRSGWRLSPKHA